MTLDSDLMIWIMALTPLAAALFCFLVSLVPAWRTQHHLQGLITIFFAFLSLVASFMLASQRGNATWPILIGEFIYLDDLGMYFVILVNLVAFFASLFTPQYMEYDARYNKYHDPRWFHVFFNLFHFTMLAVPLIDNLVYLWVMVELTTIFSTVLVRYRRDRAALEAAWKFILITTTGIIFALLGTLFLADAFPSDMTPTMNWSKLVQPQNVTRLDSQYVQLSFMFILLGYGTKAGLAPMHTWLPDGHGEAPSPVSALLSGVMLKSALYAILRFYIITNLNLGTNFTSIMLIIAGLFSLVLATPFILKRNPFKRVLAYHSLEHMGIITFGIGLGGLGFSLALFGALLHALNHALTKALMFLSFGIIQQEYHAHDAEQTSSTVNDDKIQGLLKSMPITGTILAFGGLALVGSPPFNIFLSEFMLLTAAGQAVREIENPIVQWAIGGTTVLFVASITLIFGGLVGHLSRLLLGKPASSIEQYKREDPRKWLPLALLLMLVLLFGLLIPDAGFNLPGLIEGGVKILQNGDGVR